jgi:DNA-directed RNA polymerase subunit RPC12/RpoP
MLGKLAALLIILAAVIAFFALDFMDPEPSRTCPSCGTKTLEVAQTSLGSSTVLKCTTCGTQVIVRE